MFRFLVDKMLQFVDVKIIQFQFALEATRLGWETPRYQRLPPPYSTVQYSTVQYSTITLVCAGDSHRQGGVLRQAGVLSYWLPETQR